MSRLSVRDLNHIYDTLGPSFWNQFENGNLFVSGGTGFFGKWLLESFLDGTQRAGVTKTKIYVLTRSPDVFRRNFPHLADNSKVVLWKGDVVDFEFPSEKFSFVIHGGDSPSEQRAEQIIAGGRRFHAFREAKAIEKALFLSSGAVYGPNGHEKTWQEDMLADIATRTPYGEGKFQTEKLLDGWVKARCFAFLGPHMPLSSSFAVGNFFNDVLAQKPIVIQGDGSPVRSFLYMSDLSIWLWTLLLKGQRDQAYNVGSENQVSLLKLAESLAEVSKNESGFRPKIEILQRPVAESTRNIGYVPNTEKIRKELGLVESVSLESALKFTFEWYREKLQNQSETNK